jgi:hypothetical protein
MTTRRSFLGILGAGAALPTIAPSLLRADRGPTPVSADWDMSWVKKLTGSHRAVFDAPEISEGLPVVRACLWGKQYAEVYDTIPEDTNCVLVLRHHGISLAFDDSYWAKFPKVGQDAGLGDAVTRNPVRTAYPDVPEPWRSLNLEAFRESGGIILACNLAFNLLAVPMYQEADGTSAEAATDEARKHLLPGVILMPSGFFSVSRSQEAGCQFVPAS